MMNRKVLAVLGLALLVLLVGRARHEAPVAPALPVTAANWTASADGDAVAETGRYQDMQLVMTATPGSGDAQLVIAGNPTRLPNDDQVEFHGTFDDHESFAFVGDGSGGDIQSGVDASVMADWLRHLEAGGSLVISFDDQSAAPIVFPLDGAAPSFAAWAAAARDGAGNAGFYGWHGPDAVASFLGLSLTSFFVFLAVMYLLPAVLAYARHSTQAGLILVFNILLGWTFVGWWVLLIVALFSPTWREVRRS